MTSTAIAYAVPFRLDRSRAPRVHRLVNVGDEPVHAIRVTLLGCGLLVPVATDRLEPGEALSISVIASELTQNAIAVVRWFRPSREEYLWRFSF
ncbi:hypothetical protein [Frigoribacterium faeni]|jgi:hypothetical protein|uniref:Uncharacterized protein n=1 Tax=Frigoribacterium faeni TaxID=145483 RepID=A0A7W3JIF4_9MICO|nr:hypothetical protein [Frigoribacterium faeni]MBA8813441.1 hypothetical protein [Frigoribacterium faeni]BFF14685.1 hypothetical protein GCM10025699_59880 [Microbacterium flavescens]GEK83041.1 hypothetical protein FFA01_13500 [Frigoribacterium faeni]